MHTPTLPWPRVALAVALAGTTAFAASSAVGSTGRATAATSYPACPTSHLTVWRAAPGDGAAGSTYYQLEFSNTSSGTCSIYGFPGVSAVDRDGRQLGNAATRDHRFAPTTVVVRPGGTAHAVLRITDVGVFSKASCQPVTAAGLRIYPPNQTKSVVLPFRFRACSQKGPNYLSVRTVRARAGIPGYSQ